MEFLRRSSHYFTNLHIMIATVLHACYCNSDEWAVHNLIQLSTIVSERKN